MTWLASTNDLHPRGNAAPIGILIRPRQYLLDVTSGRASRRTATHGVFGSAT